MLASMAMGSAAVFLPALLGGNPSHADSCPAGACNAGKTLSAMVGNTGIHPVDDTAREVLRDLDNTTSNAWKQVDGLISFERDPTSGIAVGLPEAALDGAQSPVPVSRSGR